MLNQMQASLWNLAPTHCAKCGRPLSNPVSVSRGIGPVCYGGTHDSGDERVSEFRDFSLFEPIENGIVLRRDEAGQVWTNIPHLVTHHSPTGFEWGYGGSGPADLALNICELMLNRLAYRGERVECWRGDCWDKAWEWHQDFKWQFLGPAKGSVITLEYETVRYWFANRLSLEAAK